MQTGYDAKTDKLIDAAADFSATDFARAAIALLDQAGCGIKCQRQVVELVSKNLEISFHTHISAGALPKVTELNTGETPDAPAPKGPRPLTAEEQANMDRVAGMSRTATLNSQGVRNLDRGRRGPVTKPNDRVPGSMQEGDRQRGVPQGKDPAAIPAPAQPTNLTPNPTWAQAHTDLKAWKDKTEAEQKAELERGRKR